MLSISNEYSKSIVSDTRDMPYRVTLEGGLVLGKDRIPKMSINENVGGSEGVALGTANSTTLSFTMKDADAIDYSGMLVEPESGLVLPDGSTEYVPLGKFWVTDYTTSNDFKTVVCTCADGMYLMTGEYISKLTYPAHIRDVAHEIVSQAGVDFAEPTSWPEVYVRRKPEGLTHREAIGHAAGCCGSNARFNRQGILEFTWYKDSGVVISRETQYLDGLTKSNYKPLEVSFEVVGQQELYEVTVISDGNGGLTATPGQSVIEGETVVVSVDPFSGYELATISAATDSGEKVTLYQNSEGGYNFVQPDSNVTVTASFKQIGVTIFNLTVRAYDGGSIRTSGTRFNAGDSPTVYIKADSGYELEKFVATPATITLTRLGTNADGETLYEFDMPESDVTINAYFKAETVRYTINRLVEGEGGYVFIRDNATGEYISSASEGTIVSVTFSPTSGYTVDRYESSVPLTQLSTNKYIFAMPSQEVSITVYYKNSVDESKVGLYSWLQMPQSAPTTKPYWAVFYKESQTLPTCQKYYLIWFDSWEATGYSTENDIREYAIQFDGYYYCGSKNNGHGSHEWDTSSWSGNGATGSTLEWDAYINRMYADWDEYYGPSTQYCLIASNCSLFYNSSLVFESCETAIQSPQTDYVQDGIDVRESNSLSFWKCPDTFSTPLPASNWMILMPDSGFYMTVGEDGKYDTPVSEFPKSVIVFFYDSITIQNLGAIFGDVSINPSNEEMYLATPTNGHWAYIRDDNSSWGTLYDLPDGAVFGLRSPLITTKSSSGIVDGNVYNFAGILATSETLYDTNGNLFMHNNSCRICDCVSETSAATTFLLRRTVNTDGIDLNIGVTSVSTDDNAIFVVSEWIFHDTGDNGVITLGVGESPTETDKVTLSYSNPMIYDKMVEPISSLIQGVTYTPSRVKYRGNPALQAGDIVTVPDKDGVYHTVLIMQQTLSFGGGMNGEITCPGKTEKTKSFSAVSPGTTKIRKEVQKSSAELEKRLAANNALVFNSMYKEIGKTESSIKSVVEWQTEKSATIAEIEQTAKENSAKIGLVVGQNGIVNEDGAVQGSVVIEAINGESTAKIKADRIELEGKKLDIKVDATNIEGEITADQINANGLEVTNGSISGNLSASVILLDGIAVKVDSDSGGAITKVKVNWSHYIEGLYVYETATTESPVPVDSIVTCYYPTSSGDKMGGSAIIKAGETSVTIKIYISQSASGPAVRTEWLSYSDSAMLVSVDGGIMPDDDNAYTLGTASRKWVDIYSQTGEINTSDEREKNSIAEIPQKLSNMFYKLKPVSYKFNEGTSDRYHTGFIAQEVERAMAECGVDSKDFAGFIKSPLPDGDYKYGLRYGEFIALAVLEIQRLNQKIIELEERINGE